MIIKENLLKFEIEIEILVTSAIKDTRKTVRRTCILLLRLKGLILHPAIKVPSSPYPALPSCANITNAANSPLTSSFI